MFQNAKSNFWKRLAILWTCRSLSMLDGGHCVQKGIGAWISNDIHTKLRCDYSSMFSWIVVEWIRNFIVVRLSTCGIFENYHSCRFHGSGVIAAPQIIGLIFVCTDMHREDFLRSSMCFRVPHLCSKYRKYTIDRWIVVYTVCASAVISPLRQWLDSYVKTRLKMWHTFKHLIHMQYFLLSTNLVIVFVHWVSTGVLYEPRQCSLFWDYVPEPKLCFCLNLCRPPGAYSIRPIQKLLNCQQREDARWVLQAFI